MGAGGAPMAFELDTLIQIQPVCLPFAHHFARLQALLKSIGTVSLRHVQDTSEEDELDAPDASFGRLLPRLLEQLAALPADARSTLAPASLTWLHACEHCVDLCTARSSSQQWLQSSSCSAG